MKYPKGYSPVPGNTKIAVSFPAELFKEIVMMAKKENITFNAMVVSLVKCGKLDLEESDKLEVN